MLLWWPFGVTAKEADAVDEKPAVDQRIATSVFEKAASGSLLSNQGPWIGPKVTGGPGISTEDRTLFLADISFTAQVICNLGRDGLEECYRRLDGKSQSARIVAIYALQLAFGLQHRIRGDRDDNQARSLAAQMADIHEFARISMVDAQQRYQDQADKHREPAPRF